MFSQYRNEYARMKELDSQLPTFVSMDHIQNDLIPGTIYATLLNAAFFFLCVWVLKQNASTTTTKKKKERKDNDMKSIYETSYLIATGVGNLFVGVMGGYYYFAVMEHPGSIDAMILGYRAMYPLSCIQMAKNLFAIPVGLTLIHDRWEMMAHHVAVLFVVIMASSMTMGFTYFAPIVFGLLEISSVPLAIMNYFKLNPEYIDRYPKFYTNVRLAFGLSFLVVRWIVSLPNLCIMLRLIFYRCLLLWKTNQFTLCILMTNTWIATAFLTMLQIFWGLLIVKSIFKGGGSSSSNNNKIMSKMKNGDQGTFKKD